LIVVHGSHFKVSGPVIQGNKSGTYPPKLLKSIHFWAITEWHNSGLENRIRNYLGAFITGIIGMTKRYRPNTQIADPGMKSKNGEK